MVEEVWAPWDVARVSCHDHRHGVELEAVHLVYRAAVHFYQASRQSEDHNSATVFGNFTDLLTV